MIVSVTLLVLKICFSCSIFQALITSGEKFHVANMRVEGCLIFWKLKSKVGYYMCRSSLPAGLLPVVIAFLLMTTPALYVTCYVVTADVNAFDCASASCNYITTIPAGTDVFISCIATGDDVNGDAQWDYVGYSSDYTLIGYVSDYYVNCGGGFCIGPSC